MAAPTTMKEVVVHPLPELRTEIREVEIPRPGRDEIVVRVVVAGSNVKGLSPNFSFPLCFSYTLPLLGVVFEKGAMTTKDLKLWRLWAAVKGRKERWGNFRP